MTDIGTIGLIIIVINLLVSYKGLKDGAFFEQYKFEVDGILVRKEFYRLVTSGFLHVSWEHLLFNMLSLYAFNALVETTLGWQHFLIVYFASLVGGDLLALFVHRQHGDYSAVGASGAVCGVIFASIAIYPDGQMGALMLPITVTSWIYGLLYVLISIYGIRSQKDNIGHEAHLGGALVGMLTAVWFYPSAWEEHYFTILAIAIPSVVFIWMIIFRPHILLINNHFYDTHTEYLDIDHLYNAKKVERQQTMDMLLDKINKHGINSLTPKEKEQLDKLSQ
jgi:membrane associated rhomboid family serine protease